MNRTNILGVIIGTINYTSARSIAFKEQLAKLILAANLRLLRWSVITWVAKGIIAKIGSESNSHIDTPHAELVAIAVCPEARGTGLSQELVEAMEKFMVSKRLSGPYTILTEKANARANRFYEKIGAKFVRTNLYHGREINQWHKKITGAK
jgi:ribosomal protein S18 acetylase RimI-like enzyme